MWYTVAMEKTTLYLPADLHRALREAARRVRTSQAQLVREALEAYVREQKPPRPRSVGLGGDSGLAARDDEAWLDREWGGELPKKR